MVALPPVDCAAHGIADQASLEGRCLEALVARLFRGEGGFRVTIGDKLHTKEQAASADVADMRMRAKPVAQGGGDLAPLRLHPADQLVLKKRGHHRMRSGTGRRVSEIGVAMLKKPASRLDGTIDIAAAQHRADRLIPGAKPLGDGQDVGAHVIRLAGKQMPGPAHAAHHLVKDQQHAMAVADLADTREITRQCRHRAKRRAHHRLGDKGHHIVRSQPEDFGLQLIRNAQRESGLILAILHLAIGIAGGDMACFHQDRVIDLPPPGIAAGRQRAKRIAMIALPAGDDMTARFLAGLDKILTRQLQRRLDCLRPAGHEIDMLDTGRRMLDQQCGQRLGRRRGEEPCMRKGKLVDLRLDGVDHRRMAVPETGDSRSAGPVEIALAVSIDDIAPLASHRRRGGCLHMARKDM